MKNPLVSVLAVGGVAGLALSVSIGGCAEDPPPAPQVAKAAPPPPPPPQPRVTPITELMERLRIDGRIRLAEEEAPPNDPARVAVLEFFDAFARGDDTMAGTMMTMADQIELRLLVEEGEWSTQIEDISDIELHCGDSERGPCVLALFTVGMDYQPQLWYYDIDGESVSFEAAPCPPGILSRLSGGDWIKVWHDIIADEMAKANEPDQIYDIPQRVVSPDGDGSASGGGGGPSGPGIAPGGPGGPPRGRRPPSKTPRRPPGPGGG